MNNYLKTSYFVFKHSKKSISNQALFKKQINFFTAESVERESLQYDVLIVGGGPAGLSAAIRLKQLEQKHNRQINVCVIEKGAEIGSHILSGNCFQPKALDELFPNWRQMEKRPPLDTPVNTDQFLFLANQRSGFQIPWELMPSTIHNQGNYIISLGNLAKWMKQRAQEMGVDIFSGTSGKNFIFEGEKVVGVTTGDMGISKKGEKKDNFTPGINIKAKQTILTEGARGSLSENIIKQFNLRKDCDPQIYGIGLKQVWEVSQKYFQSGLVQHTVGWPLDRNTYGGSFIYHMEPNLVHVGYVVGLQYQNPYINPYEQLQRFKTHPLIKQTFEGGNCISYGARVINAGGYFSIPKLTFPGGMLAGCSAGFLNVMKIKGTHTAMQTGMLAAQSTFKAILQKTEGAAGLQLTDYEKSVRDSWAVKQLYETRNFKNSFQFNMYSGLAMGGIQSILKGKHPFNLRNKLSDSEFTQPSDQFKPINYPKHDGKLTFDLLLNLSRSGTNHNHDQPSHLVIQEDKQESILQSYQQYGAPQERFCPAKVYEFIQDEKGQPKLQINAQNCIHCQTCSIKMVDEYIDWNTPEGGGGPQYSGM